MSASDLTQRRRIVATLRGSPSFPKSYEYRLAKIIGISESLCCGLTDPIAIERTVRTGLTAVLEAVAAAGRSLIAGPTRGSRIIYMWFYGIHSAYTWPGVATLTHAEQCTWMLRTAIVVTQQITPTADLSALISLTHANDGWVDIQAKGDWPAWNQTWGSWLATRANDGSIEAEVPPPTLPNGATRIQSNATLNPSEFPRPAEWTPVGTQTYLTYGWGDVSSACLTVAQETAILAAANAEFPTSAERTIEITDLLTLTSNLGDRKKVEAEFWAGGSGTPAPPGILMILWREFTASAGISADTVIRSGHDLAERLFETGRLVWSLKREHMQARPIQEIRLNHPVPLWKPYIGTPPFPDFPSGHSAFSQSFALIMTKWFGPTVPATLPRRMEGLSLVCPALENSSTQQFGTFVFPARSSAIDATVPTQPVTLTWTSWQDMADSAGMSRQYGGIHAESAHVASQFLANELQNQLKAQELP